MRGWIALAVAATALAACGDTVRPCKEGTAFLAIAYDAAAANADRITIHVVVDGAQMSFMAPHAAGSGADSAEIDFDAGYPAGKTITVDVTASANGVTVGAGSAAGVLASGCFALSVSVTGGLAGADFAMPRDQAGPTDGGGDAMPALKSINVTPTSPVLPVGAKLQLKATGTYSDNSSLDLTSLVTWASNPASTASITPTGMVTALQAGNGPAVITAVLDGVTGSDALGVSAATLKTIMVSPAVASIGVNSTLQMSATGIYSDNTSADLTASVNWSASNGDVTVGGTGLATGKAQGMVTVTADLGGIAGTAKLTVTAAMLASITITPAQPSLATGTNRQMAATGSYDDNSTQDLTAQVTWASDAPLLATVSAAGLVHAVSVGTANITATLGKVGTTSVTVTAPMLIAVIVAPAMPTLSAGTTGNFTATGMYNDGSTQDLTATATWSSSDPTVASVSNAGGSQGLVTALAMGTSDIGATFMGQSGSSTLTVSAAALLSIAVMPGNTTLHLQTSQQLTAIGKYSDNTMQDLTTQVTWSSGDPSVTVSNVNGSNGLATAQQAMANLMVTITATRGGINGTATIVVDTTPLQTITITPNAPAIGAGLELQLIAIGQFGGAMQDITRDVAWSTANGQIATVSNSAGTNGLLTAISQGQTQVNASLSHITGSTNVTVKPPVLVALKLSPMTFTLGVGKQLSYTASAVYSDNSTMVVTNFTMFSSSDPTVVTFNMAVAKSLKAGMVTVNGVYMGLLGTATLTVQ